MKSLAARLSTRFYGIPTARVASRPTASLARVRALHAGNARAADVAPIVGTGPPPQAPVSQAEEALARVKRRRRQAEMLKLAKQAKAGGKTLSKRFWDEVHVKEVDGSLQVFLDQRPLRHPTTKEVVRIPATKPHLATALALEWDLLSSVQDATRQHLIPLTGLICRALDLEAEGPSGPSRSQIAKMVMRYLDTDSVLCWAPEGDATQQDAQGRTLRELQRASAEEIGVAGGDDCAGAGRALDRAEEPGRGGAGGGGGGWRVVGVGAPGWRGAVLAGKSLLIAARLVVQWSEDGARVVGEGPEDGGRFCVESAARAASLEVAWQTGNWGEVEDTHDVDKEDIRRQFGSVVLLVSGTGRN
ncbi:hypothetical protein jhhlp_003815 [Lomentospora prolificans]|uniref:ATP12 chaperone protein n=1 Tax=Lomentospora prolificans TaxID=41688 RepID=A0A2N3N9V5_9PEZI|nr:hypothetical protein jhhlp_003815 [Lomentospora prolificans]